MPLLRVPLRQESSDSDVEQPLAYAAPSPHGRGPLASHSHLPHSPSMPALPTDAADAGARMQPFRMPACSSLRGMQLLQQHKPCRRGCAIKVLHAPGSEGPLTRILRWCRALSTGLFMLTGHSDWVDKMNLPAAACLG